MRDLEDEERIKAYMAAKMTHIKMYNECMNLADGLDVEKFAELVRADERAKREWVGLTRDEVLDIEEETTHPLAFYDAIEAKPKGKDEDKRASGLWRLTPHGHDFIRRRITMPKYAFVFDNKLIKHSKEQVDAVQALGKKFSYDELMNTRYRSIK